MFNPFDDMGGKFVARLKRNKLSERRTSSGRGEIQVTAPVSIIEIKFDLDVLDRLYKPGFVAIEAPKGENEYLIFEVIAPKPIHFQMLGISPDVPTVLREEFLNTIKKGWTGSEETWIDVYLAPTHYKMKLDGEPKFERSLVMPLVGAYAYMLSKEAVSEFLCVRNGVRIGEMMGFEIPLTVDLESMLKYHTGVFGFTGTGKSNLTSFILREVLDWTDVNVIVMDLAGEYSVYLLDRLLEDGVVYSTEEFKEPERFLDAQAIPESLGEKMDLDILYEGARRLFEKGAVKGLSLEEEMGTLGFFYGALERLTRSDRAGAFQVEVMLKRLMREMREMGYGEDTRLSELGEEALEHLLRTLNDIKGYLSSKSDAAKQINYMVKLLEEPFVELDGKKRPEEVVQDVLTKGPRITVVYEPDPVKARAVASRMIDRLLYLKKVTGARKRVLFVLDEAQEFIPSDTKAKGSAESNMEVEALLRQGRKYRAHCWISTQRVAHLNVNALQQLHSYFLSVLPRTYDRAVIADAFSLNYELLEKCTELETGEWIFVSYKATKQRNVPVFVRVPDNELLLAEGLKRLKA